jgi:hypothetical protein
VLIVDFEKWIYLATLLRNRSSPVNLFKVNMKETNRKEGLAILYSGKLGWG